MFRTTLETLELPMALKFLESEPTKSMPMKSVPLGWLRQLSIRMGYDVHKEDDIMASYITALYFTTSSLTSGELKKLDFAWMKSQ